MGMMIYQNIICYFSCVKTRVMANFAKFQCLQKSHFKTFHYITGTFRCTLNDSGKYHAVQINYCILLQCQRIGTFSKLFPS